MYSKQPGLTYSACGPFTKNKEKIITFMQTRNTNFIYKNYLDKACFQYDAAHAESKDLARITQSDKVWTDKDFEIAGNPKYDGYQRGLASMMYNDIQKSSGNGVAMLTNKSNVNSLPNYQFANELCKQIIRTFKRGKVFSSFKDNIWSVDLADM